MDTNMNAREELDKWMLEHHYQMDKPIGYSVVSDFAEWYAEQKLKPDVDNMNWFERLPLYLKLLYYFIGGLIVGLLLQL